MSQTSLPVRDVEPAGVPSVDPTQPATQPATRPSRIDSLTGLRIFAAVAVYLSHAGTPDGAPTWLATFMTSGYSGVTLFFVLSGFVLSLNYFHELRSPSAAKLWRYAVARFARVYPVYLLVLLYVIVSHRTAGVTVDPWLGHVLAIQAWHPEIGYAFALNGPAWSISVELFLYACFPLVVIALARLRSIRALLAVAGITVCVLLGLAAGFAVTGANELVSDPGSAHRWLYRSPLTRLGDFVLGIVAARLYLAGWAARRPGQPGYRWIAWAAPVAALTFCALMTVRPLLKTTWSWDVMYAIPAVILIFGLATVPDTRLGRFLARPTVVRLGAASYAFYLLHVVLIGRLDAARWTDVVTPMIVVYSFLTFGLILAAAVGVHQLVEDPTRRWIHRRVLGRVASSNR